MDFNINHMKQIDKYDDWQSCKVPRLMLMGLKERGNKGVIGRELRLFACACVRHAGDFLIDKRSLHAVEVAERYADGNASQEELEASHSESEIIERSIYRSIINSDNYGAQDIDDWQSAARILNAAVAVSHCTDTVVMSSNSNPHVTYPGDWYIAASASFYAHKSTAANDSLMYQEEAFLAQDENYIMYEDEWQASALRCIFMNPSKIADCLNVHLSHECSDMARAIYNRRSFDEVPILGMMLSANGDEYASEHCVSDSLHVMGCWALDMARGLNRFC